MNDNIIFSELNISFLKRRAHAWARKYHCISKLTLYAGFEEEKPYVLIAEAPEISEILPECFVSKFPDSLILSDYRNFLSDWSDGFVFYNIGKDLVQAEITDSSALPDKWGCWAKTSEEELRIDFILPEISIVLYDGRPELCEPIIESPEGRAFEKKSLQPEALFISTAPPAPGEKPLKGLKAIADFAGLPYNTAKKLSKDLQKAGVANKVLRGKPPNRRWWIEAYPSTLKAYLENTLQKK